MKNTRTIVTVLLLAVVSFFAGSLLAAVDQSSAYPIFPSQEMAVTVTAGGLLSVSLAKRYATTPSWLKWAAPGAHTGQVNVAAVQAELWVDFIIDKLFRDNSILRAPRRLDSYVLGGKVVHLPQAGANVGGEKNRTVYPGTVVQRTDTELTFPLDHFTTNPVLLQNAEQAELSYDKMASLMVDQMEWLDEAVTNEMLFNWSGVGADQILRTSGADSSANLAHGTATGTRKRMTAADFKNVMVALNKQNVAKEGRVALLCSDMLGELLEDPMLQARDVAREADYQNGRIARLYGFDIMERSTVNLFTNAAPPVKKAVGAADAASDNQSSLFFQKNAIGLGMGSVEFFESKADPTYYGDIYSALVRCGGRQLRADGKGVISLVQAHGA